MRAITRAATAENEDALVNLGRYGTAAHVEKVVSSYRRAKRLQDPETADEQHLNRSLDYYYDADGSLIIKGRFPAEKGALIIKALEMAMDQEFAVRAGPSPRPENEIDHGVNNVSAETSRRVGCDCSIIAVLEDGDGEPLSVGRKTRAIPPAIRRALRFRDKGCRFPGCTNTRYVDGHHIEHWADGGDTSLENLVQLCRHHHRLVHEGGFGCKRLSDGEIEFTAPDQLVLDESPPRTGMFHEQDPYAWFEREMRELEIDSHTCEAKWYAGEVLDQQHAVSSLFS